MSRVGRYLLKELGLKWPRNPRARAQRRDEIVDAARFGRAWQGLLLTKILVLATIGLWLSPRDCDLRLALVALWPIISAGIGKGLSAEMKMIRPLPARFIAGSVGAREWRTHLAR